MNEIFMQTFVAFLSGVVFIPAVNYWLVSVREKREARRKGIVDLYNLTIDFETELKQYSSKFHNYFGYIKKDISNEELHKLINDLSVGYVQSGPDPFSIANRISALSKFVTPSSSKYVKIELDEWKKEHSDLYKELVMYACGIDRKKHAESAEEDLSLSILSIIYKNSRVNDKAFDMLERYRNDLLEEYNKIHDLFKYFRLKR